MEIRQQVEEEYTRRAQLSAEVLLYSSDASCPQTLLLGLQTLKSCCASQERHLLDAKQAILENILTLK